MVEENISQEFALCPIEYIITLKINIIEENISQEFTLHISYGTRNYFVEEINQNDLMSKRHKKVCTF